MALFAQPRRSRIHMSAVLDACDPADLDLHPHSPSRLRTLAATLPAPENIISIGPLTCVPSCVKLYGEWARLSRQSNRPFTGLSRRFEGVTTGGNSKLLHQIILADANPGNPRTEPPCQG